MDSVPPSGVEFEQHLDGVSLFERQRVRSVGVKVVESYHGADGLRLSRKVRGRRCHGDVDGVVFFLVDSAES